MQISATAAPSLGEAEAKSPLYVFFLAAVAAIAGFLFGFDTAVINGVLLFLRRQLSLSNIETEVAASALLLGCLLGAAGASLISDRIGRCTRFDRTILLIIRKPSALSPQHSAKRL